MDEMRRNFDLWMRANRGRKARPGEFLEGYVTYMYQSLLVLHAQNIRVTNGAKVADKRGNTYAIDVYFEFEVAGVRHRVAIECKDHKRRTTRDEVIAFHGKISDMPSTIGVFVSMKGFQSGALRYLEDHGIKYVDGETIPDFGRIIASWLGPIALPDESAIGQPFWTIRQAEDGEPTASWLLTPIEDSPPSNGTLPDRAIPLFLSRPEAMRYGRLRYGDDGTWCTCGLEQPSLRAMIDLAELDAVQFAIMYPFAHEGRRLYQCQVWSPLELSDEFIVVGAAIGTLGCPKRESGDG
ncbi:hypothetical protein GCM10027055_04350 [Janibacter alkaliphilus]|uniref:Restriction endonuclease type IV Mrr domain-containing protein n=2 Tax=Janibacter alkaliphilus TaxID=1069963 RepID=A0A852X6J6_9MICO|nr:hypothetical protein [Janibacter alkaliphilus]